MPRWQLAALWALAIVAAAIIGTHGIAYWDAGDYVLLAIDGGKSGLLLGRPLFIWISRLVVLAVDPSHAEVVLRWFWSVFSALAAPLMAVLAIRAGLSRRAALIAGAAMALSPSFAHTSHQVLTDGPALVLAIAALVCAASFTAGGPMHPGSQRPVAAGLLLAAAIATRETAAVHVIAMSLLLGRRAPVAIGVCVAALAVVIVIQPPAVGPWWSAMSASSAGHPWSVFDLAMSIVWVFASGPFVVLFGLAAFVAAEQRRVVRVIGVPALVATGLLLFYPDGSFSPRYVLATVPLATFLAAAAWLATRPAIAIVALVVPFAASVIAARPANDVARRGAEIAARVVSLPPRALVVPGHFCPQARLAASMTGRADLEFVCPGWSWPANLTAVLDSALAADRPVAIDVSDEAWVGDRERAPRDETRAWLFSRGQAANSAGFTITTR